jgi:hypothetical protein
VEFENFEFDYSDFLIFWILKAKDAKDDIILRVVIEYVYMLVIHK